MMKETLTEKEKKTYVSLYKKDTLSYTLTLFAILAELVYVISILDVMAVSFWMGVTVMVNIGMLFALFTCAVKMNIYDRKWAVIAVILGMYILVRQFILVPFVLRPYDRTTRIAAANIVGAALIIAAGMSSTAHSSRREKLQKELGGE